MKSLSLNQMKNTQGGGYYDCNTGVIILDSDLPAFQEIFHLIAHTSRFPNSTLSQFLSQRCTFVNGTVPLHLQARIEVPELIDGGAEVINIFDI